MKAVGRRLLAGVCLLAASACAGGPEPREITLITRGMAFVFEGEGHETNPIIRVAPGERVRITLRNEAPGLIHDLQIPAWNLGTPPLRAGETATLDFTVPAGEGRYEYHCTPHSTMMRGFVEVAAE